MTCFCLKLNETTSVSYPQRFHFHVRSNIKTSVFPSHPHHLEKINPTPYSKLNHQPTNQPTNKQTNKQTQNSPIQSKTDKQTDRQTNKQTNKQEKNKKRTKQTNKSTSRNSKTCFSIWVSSSESSKWLVLPHRVLGSHAEWPGQESADYPPLAAPAVDAKNRWPASGQLPPVVSEQQCIPHATTNGI